MLTRGVMLFGRNDIYLDEISCFFALVRFLYEMTCFCCRISCDMSL
jgi:hypothetical protein